VLTTLAIRQPPHFRPATAWLIVGCDTPERLTPAVGFFETEYGHPILFGSRPSLT